VLLGHVGLGLVFGCVLSGDMIRKYVCVCMAVLEISATFNTAITSYTTLSDIYMKGDNTSKLVNILPNNSTKIFAIHQAISK